MKVLFVSLGCDKNSVDTEVMLGILSKEGYSFTDDESDADIAIVNTCCFIGDAKKESIDTLIELGSARTSGRLKALIATGCLSQRYAEDIHKDLPEVDALVGIASIEHIAEALNNVLKGNPRDYFDSTDNPIHGAHKRVLTTGGYYDYLKIAEGCNKRCTYCVIPSVRGNYRSIPIEELIEEAKDLVSKGVKEIIIVAQEITVYGIDIYGYKALPSLLKQLCEIEDLKLVRLLYCYPEEITDELIDCIASESKIVKYLDMPIQSGSDNVLRKMGRKTNYNELKELVSKIRKRIPDMCLRTTLITGFPGETIKDHKASLNLINELQFDRLGVFKYSREENTKAASMSGQKSAFVKNLRYKELMKAQQKIAFLKTNAMIGRDVEAIIEGYIPDEGVYVGRTYRDAPSVDGYVFVSSRRELMSGDIVDIKISKASGYDLIGELIDELT